MWPYRGTPLNAAIGDVCGVQCSGVGFQLRTIEIKYTLIHTYTSYWYTHTKHQCTCTHTVCTVEIGVDVLYQMTSHVGCILVDLID